MSKTTMCILLAAEEQLAFLVEHLGEDERIVLIRDGKPAAALVSVADLQELERLDRFRAAGSWRHTVDRPDSPHVDIVGRFYAVLARALAERRVGFSQGGLRGPLDPPQPPEAHTIPEGLTLADLGWTRVSDAPEDAPAAWELPGFEAGALGGQGFIHTARIPGAYWPGPFYRLLQQTAAEMDHTLLAPKAMMNALESADRLFPYRNSEIWGRVRRCRYLDLSPLLDLLPESRR
ncbi:MAG: type II toxin-antitoxin system Phd/YefM family antitoxin [Egibacteraceae bacterium]